MKFTDTFERALRVVAPGLARRRAEDRWRTTILEQTTRMMEVTGASARAYAGASMTDQTSLWAPAATSANSEASMSIEWLRRRSRQLVRDEPLIGAAPRRLVSNAIGDGERISIEHPDRRQKEQAQALWNAHCESTAIDADGVHDFYGLQALVLRGAIEGGDCLSRRRWRKLGDGLDVPFQLQLLEGEHLDVTRDLSTSEPTKRGVVFDGIGRRRGYWLFREHPGEFAYYRTPESSFVPAADVAHVFRCERPGMVAGVPWGAPTLLLARQLGDWRFATMLRLQAANSLVAFVTEIDPDNSPAPLSPGNATGNEPTTLNAGAVEYLRAGQDVKFSNPPGVNGVDSFVTFARQEIAVAYGMTYEALTGDLSRVNFTSARMGWLEFQRELKIWRRDVLRRPFNDRVFQWFLEAADTAGLLRNDGKFRATWTPSRREFIDASAEIAGIVAKVRAGLSTWSEEAREMGWDPLELAETYEADLRLLDAHGLIFECDARVARAGSAAPQQTSKKTGGSETKKTAPKTATDDESDAESEDDETPKE